MNKFYDLKINEPKSVIQVFSIVILVALTGQCSFPRHPLKSFEKIRKRIQKEFRAS